MAWTNKSLQIEDILVTDFIPDSFSKIDQNFSEIKGNFDDLINNLQIDVIAGKIGTTDPVNLLNTQNIILDAGSLIYKNTSNTQVASLVLDSNDRSMLTVDSLVTNLDVTITGDLTVVADVTALNITATGSLALSGKATFVPAPAYGIPVVTVNLIYNSVTNIAEGTLTISNTTPKFNFLVLAADSQTYSGSFNGALSGVKIKLAFSTGTPPADGTEFNVGFAKMLSGTTDITSAYAGLGFPINLIPESTLAIQGNAVGTLGSGIAFTPVSYSSNITFVKASFGGVKRLLIVGEKNMTS